MLYNCSLTINVNTRLAYGYSGDTDPPCPVMLTPHKDYGSKNLND